MPRACFPILLLLAGLVPAWAPPAAAQVHRCVDANGVAVYTDRPCEAVQATPREAPADPAAGANFTSGFAVRGCARRPETLLSGVRGALEARDVNRLASWYHWTGTGTGTARALMDELEAIANRPLVSVELVYPQPAGNGVRFTSPQQVSEPENPGEVNLTPFPSDPESPGEVNLTPSPVSLRVQQMRGPADIEAVTVHFALRQNAGCWWIEL